MVFQEINERNKKIRELRSEGHTLRELSQEFDLTEKTLMKICSMVGPEKWSNEFLTSAMTVPEAKEAGCLYELFNEGQGMSPKEKISTMRDNKRVWVSAEEWLRSELNRINSDPTRKAVLVKDSIGVMFIYVDKPKDWARE